MRSLLVIPARHGSTRFPGKPLAHLAGRPVIEHVARAALASSVARPVLVATDDERIAKAVEAAFSQDEVAVAMTSESCRTGTERIAEVVRERFDDAMQDSGTRLIVINVQGDEPFVNPRHIDALVQTMSDDPSLRMATLATPLVEGADDPNVVKVVLDAAGRALYFSRAPIPFERLDAGETSHVRRLRHLGLYAYEARWLLEMAALPPTPLEECEKLEQLRALENGVNIGVAVVEGVVPIAIDTPGDLEAAEKYWQCGEASG